MFGGFALEAYSSTHDDIHDWWFEPIENPGNLKNNIKNVLQGAIGEASSITHVPEFPILHPMHSRIVVGERKFGDAEEANRVLFHDLLRSNKYRQHEDYFGGAVGGRRASPLIAQVRQIDNSWYPVLTYMRSRPERAGGRRADWHVVDSFMNDAEKLFDGETVWGGRFA